MAAGHKFGQFQVWSVYWGISRDRSGHPGAIELAIVRDDHIDLQS